MIITVGSMTTRKGWMSGVSPMMGFLTFLSTMTMGGRSGVVRAQLDGRMLGPPVDTFVVFDANSMEGGEDGGGDEDSNTMVMIDAVVPLQDLTEVEPSPSSTLAPTAEATETTLIPTVNFDTTSPPSGMGTLSPPDGGDFRGDQGDLETEQELILSLSLSFLFPRPTPSTPFPTAPLLTPQPTPMVVVPATSDPTFSPTVLEVVMTEEPTTALPTLPPVPGQTPDPTVMPSAAIATPDPSPFPSPDPTLAPSPEPSFLLDTSEPTEMEINTARPTRGDVCRDSTTARFKVVVDYKARWGCGLIRQADPAVIRWYCNNVVRAEPLCKATCGVCQKGSLIDNGNGRRKSVCRDKGGRRPLIVIESRPCAWLNRQGDDQRRRLCARKARMRRFCPVACDACP